MFIDRPSELGVKFPRDKGKQDCEERQNARRSDEVRLQFGPDNGINSPGIAQRLHRHAHLVDLDSGVDHHAQIINAQADDLDGVLQAQRIPDQNQLVEEAEDEDGEVSGDCEGAGRGIGGVCVFRRGGEFRFELPEDVRF